MSTRHRRLLLGYLALLAVSHLVRGWRTAPPPAQDPAETILTVAAVDGDHRLSQSPVRLAFDRFQPADPATAAEAASRPPVLLLHGSPGDKHNFAGIAPELSRSYQVLIPDLPGFGHSQHQVPDYSIHAHADYVLQLLDQLGVRRAHVVGFSLGGGVALELAHRAPERIASLTLLSSVGVQEMELLGNYQLNHVIHGLQLAGLWLLQEAVPHFGYLDDAVLGLSYARNFYDTDQRPLRGYLAAYDGPMLILHGRNDVLVPVAAALEHYRLVPQSELELVDRNHFFVFTQGPEVARRLEEFCRRVDAGDVRVRATATAERRARAAEPFDPRQLPPVSGFALVVLLVVIAVSTLVSEDLTCIGAGLLVAAGRLPYLPATLACLIGIYVGDMLLYAAGRFLGRPAIHRIPLRWLLRGEDIEASSRWFNRRGPTVILLSRFVPGTRLPTYFAAGLFRTHFLRFSFYFLLAAVAWTPLLVALAMWLGAGAWHYFELFQSYAWLVLGALVLVILVAARVIVPAATWRGRRLLRGSLRRWWRWEYWPPWLFYPPVVLWVLCLGLRYRCLTLFTAANPGVPASGLVGESKSQILDALSASSSLVARYRKLAGDTPAAERLRQVEAFRTEHGLDYPLVLKPDAGQRGSGVIVARSQQEVAEYIEANARDTIVQEYVAGPEVGVFYVRLPEEPRGRIFSITDKRLPAVVGDGERNLEELILAENRLLGMAAFYLRRQDAHLDEVPAAGEPRQLVDLGTHCRGAVFLDGNQLRTPQLEAAIEELSQGFEGFFFGRYDLRARSLDDLRQGEGFKVLELNGVTSEATEIYDPGNSLLRAYRILFRQWQLAFEIGRQNAARGARPLTLVQLVRLLWWHFRNPGEAPPLPVQG